MVRVPIIIDCNKQSDGYVLMLNPKFKDKIKRHWFTPKSLFLGYDGEVKKLNGMQWCTLVKMLLSLKRMIPCVVKQPVTGKAYFRFLGE